MNEITVLRYEIAENAQGDYDVTLSIIVDDGSPRGTECLMWWYLGPDRMSQYDDILSEVEKVVSGELDLPSVYHRLLLLGFPPHVEGTILGQRVQDKFGIVEYG